MASSIPAYARVGDLQQHWNPHRARTLKPASAAAGGAAAAGGVKCVVYWMSRDQRAHDNWALLHAQQLACAQGVPLYVAFCLLPSFLGAPLRHFAFMLRGLSDVEAELRAVGVPFHLLRGAPAEVLPAFAAARGASTLVCDFSPLNIARGWKEDVASALPAATALVEVDAHNVIPAWHASDKQEVGARTLRPKIERLLPTFLTEFPALRAHPHPPTEPAPPPNDWPAVIASLGVDARIGEVDWCAPGEGAAHAALGGFMAERLRIFGAKRNDPNADALSNLSPYLHYGQLAPQRAALVVKGARAHADSVKGYLEEAVVRRELADNFCLYNRRYDSLDGAAGWARDSLALHAADPREFVYAEAQLAAAQTHDDLWNAAQNQMVRSGKMHGFMRMYWAKKVLEWTASPAEALRIANALNDRYSLDGRDPSGYVGVAWSVMGTHDMGWAERPVFGKIRYMNYAGCKRKFDVATYVRAWGGGSGAPPAAAPKAKAKAAAPKEAAAKATAVAPTEAGASAAATEPKAKVAAPKAKAAAAAPKDADAAAAAAAPKAKSTATKKAATAAGKASLAAGATEPAADVTSKAPPPAKRKRAAASSDE
jgi:deoxyribodipyrimidine photo-lyase